VPLLATLIGGIASGLVAVFSRFVAFELALKLASYVAWIGVVTVFAGSVFVCTAGLMSAASAIAAGGGGTGNGAAILGMFLMGLGMFIPANASTVIGCMSSVWIACQVYKIQKQGMHHYSK
jgi:hypothetical protein